MVGNKTISVALASYNGEKYIREQIVSICEQTVKPDEIIISDDGSVDSTRKIIIELAEKYISEGIKIKFLKNNNRHGYCGNFEWAITHTSGDYIFISDQDDLWYANKISLVMQVFERHPDAECVIHEADLINENGEKISGVFNRWSKQYLLDNGVNSDYQISRDKYLDAAVSFPLSNGMVLCLSRKSLESSLPFPKCDGSHDTWLIFSAVCNDKCWFTPEIVEGYRLHGNNTCGSRVYKGSRREQFKKRIKKLKISGIRNSLDLMMLGKEMIRAIESVNYTDSLAYKTAKRVFDIGSREVKAVTSGRISGSLQLIKMYKTDMRYRSIGKASFAYQVIRILLYGKRKRTSIIFDVNN